MQGRPAPSPEYSGFDAESSGNPSQHTSLKHAHTLGWQNPHSLLTISLFCPVSKLETPVLSVPKAAEVPPIMQRILPFASNTAKRERLHLRVPLPGMHTMLTDYALHRYTGVHAQIAFRAEVHSRQQRTPASPQLQKQRLFPHAETLQPHLAILPLERFWPISLEPLVLLGSCSRSQTTLVVFCLGMGYWMEE